LAGLRLSAGKVAACRGQRVATAVYIVTRVGLGGEAEEEDSTEYRIGASR